MQKQVDSEVLIIGAGPVGLVAAIKLSLQGVSIRIVDANTENRKLTKASGIHVRSLELLPFEVVKNIQSKAINVLHAQLNEVQQDGGVKTLVDIDMNGLSDTFCQGMLSQEQWRTEEVLEKYLEERCKVKVERGTKVIALDDFHDFVKAELENETGNISQSINVKWVIGCDGSHSFTRKRFDIAYPGTNHKSDFLALHASFEGLPEEHTQAPRVNISFSQSVNGWNGMVFHMPMPNDYPRSLLITADLSEAESQFLSCGKVNKYGRNLLREITPEEAISILDGRLLEEGKLKLIPGSVKWCTTFTVNSRQASKYRSGRVFLAGDAAHCHSPLGGQGMNMGIQDVVNLSWKLVQVIEGKSDASLLDTYESERIEIDRQILSYVTSASNLAWNRSPIVSLLRSNVQHLLGKMLSILPLAAFVHTLQMTSYSYSNSSDLSHEHWERPSLWPFPISRVFPFGGYRRRQNLFRWTGQRVRAGDRLPNIEISRYPKETFYPYQGGWMLILCEGQVQHNIEMKRNLNDVEIFSVEQLRSVGEKLKRKLGIIDKVVVIPSSSVNAYDRLGVHGQCILVVRPDSHVGLRSEPVRTEIVLDYFVNRVKLLVEKPENYRAPLSSRNFDPVPLLICLSIIVSGFTMYRRLPQF